jgi:hypothetical protein
VPPCLPLGVRAWLGGEVGRSRRIRSPEKALKRSSFLRFPVRAIGGSVPVFTVGGERSEAIYFTA